MASKTWIIERKLQSIWYIGGQGGRPAQIACFGEHFPAYFNVGRKYSVDVCLQWADASELFSNAGMNVRSTQIFEQHSWSGGLK